MKYQETRQPWQKLQAFCCLLPTLISTVAGDAIVYYFFFFSKLNFTLNRNQIFRFRLMLSSQMSAFAVTDDFLMSRKLQI